VNLAKQELLKGEKGKKALEYLTQKRKISKSILDKFNIGYCPEDVNHQVRGRIITPIYDAYNHLVALSTRHLDENFKPRFWHESFDKGSYLYGLNHAKDTIQNVQKVIIVEGEIDVLSLFSYGFTMSVGMSCSSLTLFQISLIARYCHEFYLLFDGDSPGKTAIDRMMRFYSKENLKSFGLNFYPVYLPEGHDPDDFLNKYGAKELKLKLKESRDNLIGRKK
jgi:DNA primase